MNITLFDFSIYIIYYSIFANVYYTFLSLERRIFGVLQTSLFFMYYLDILVAS